MKKSILMIAVFSLVLTACGGGAASSESGSGSSAEKKDDAFDKAYVEKLAGYPIDGLQWKEERKKIEGKKVSIDGKYNCEGCEGDQPSISFYRVNDLSTVGSGKKVNTPDEYKSDVPIQPYQVINCGEKQMGGEKVLWCIKTPKEVSENSNSLTLSGTVCNYGVRIEWIIIATAREEGIEAKSEELMAFLEKAVTAMPKP
jgi:hypothetical protein